ncbi:hypothetical protein [Aureimonas ureilytica]|nr:hypothetical protein [Aureimonas ureilytica]
MTSSASRLAVTCPMPRGIVAAISTYLASRGWNIIDSAPFHDMEAGCFFTHVGFRSEEGVGLEALRSGFGPVAEPFWLRCKLSNGAQ